MRKKISSKVFDFTPEFIILLFILGFILKLSDIINWSWWVITSPIWSLLLIGSILYLICLITRKTH
jgi:membrane protein YdbS with pleckstrin-like domain